MSRSFFTGSFNKSLRRRRWFPLTTWHPSCSFISNIRSVTYWLRSEFSTLSWRLLYAIAASFIFPSKKCLWWSNFTIITFIVTYLIWRTVIVANLWLIIFWIAYFWITSVATIIRIITNASIIIWLTIDASAITIIIVTITIIHDH